MIQSVEHGKRRRIRQATEEEKRRRSRSCRNWARRWSSLAGAQLDALALPARFAEAVLEEQANHRNGDKTPADAIYIGKIMRKVDPEPVRVGLRGGRPPVGGGRAPSKMPPGEMAARA